MGGAEIRNTAPAAGGGQAPQPRYLLTRNGQQFGPYSLEEMRRYIGEGRVAESDMVWTQGMPQWVPLRQILAGHAATPPALPAQRTHLPMASHPAHHVSPHVVVKPPSHLLWAILTTLLCCLPFGIVSIVYASQVESKFSNGDYPGAQQASDTARNWAIAGAVGGLIVAVISILSTVATNAN